MPSARESRIRRAAKRHNFIVTKSRAKSWSLDNQQEYKLICGASGYTVDGHRYDMTLTELEDFFFTPETVANSTPA